MSSNSTSTTSPVTHTTRGRAPLAYPLRALLDLSTGCLSPETRTWLENLDWKNEGPSGAPTDYGWLIYAHDDNLSHPSAPHAPDGEFPADLWACMVRANAMGAAYILFDCDAASDDDSVSDLCKWSGEDSDDDSAAIEESSDKASRRA